MDAIVSAITSDLVARSVSFLMARCLNNRTPVPTGDEMTGRLQRLLLRAQVIVEEADGRRITSHAMLRQLSKLREEMYRGCHALDTCSSRRRRDAGDGGEASRCCSAMSRSNPSKRVCLMMIRSGGGDHRSGDQLQHVVERLEITIADMSEFVIFLTGCPRLSRQPYSAYMFMDKCMFGRQMELERVVAFLLENHGSSGEAGVLTILGPRRSGKSTLVEHACSDERVRDHFSQIVSFTLGDLRCEGTAVSVGSGGGGGGGLIKHRRHHVDEERVLVIVELDGERNSKGLDEAIINSLLRGFYSTYKSHIPYVTKIIVTSRSEKIASLGTATTQLVRLNPLSQEAYWYFFKTRAFGSTDAADHPKLVSTAMDMADEMDGCFSAANIFSALLRSNFNIQFWSLALEVLRDQFRFRKRNLIKYDLIQSTETDPLKMTKPAYTKEVAKQLVYLDAYQINSCTRGEVPIPKVSLKDILFADARPQGKFDVLAWKSTIPPYYSYAYTCEIQIRPPRMVATKNRGVKIGDS